MPFEDRRNFSGFSPKISFFTLPFFTNPNFMLKIAILPLWELKTCALFTPPHERFPKQVFPNQNNLHPPNRFTTWRKETVGLPNEDKVGRRSLCWPKPQTFRRWSF